MVGALSAVVPLAIAGALSPLILIVGVSLLGGARPRVQTSAFAIGVFATTVVMFGLGFAASHLQRTGPEPGLLGSRWAYLVIGLFLTAAAIFVLVKRPKPKRTGNAADRFLSRDRNPALFTAAGVAMMITHVSAFVILIAIIHAVGSRRLSLIEELVAFAVAAVIVSLPGTIPVPVALLSRDTEQSRIERIRDFVIRFGTLTMALIWLVFGVLNLVRFLTA